MNGRAVTAVAVFFVCGALDASKANAQPSGNANATPPAIASTTNPSTSMAGAGQYKPRYLPSEVTLTQAQIDEVSKKVTEQYVQYHESLVEQNKSAAIGQKLWAQRAQESLVDDKWHLDHARGVYKSQSLYSFAIFAMVMLITIVSLVLTIHQFLRDSSTFEKLANTVRSRLAQKKSSGSSPLTTEELAVISKLADAVRGSTNADIGAAGVKIGTQLVGLAMLAFSMGFFYLYLKHVYPITVAPPAAQSEIARGEGAKKE